MHQTHAQKIKSGTANAHARTEKALIKYVKLINSNSAYARLLGCLYGYFKPIEQQLDHFSVTLTNDYDQRRKANKMLNDIQLLQSPVVQDFAANIPVINNPSEAMGCLYVLEGSVLGGTIIKDRIKSQCQHIIPEQSFSFFSGYGQQTGAMWQSFITQFNSFFKSDEQLIQAITSANHCFEKLEDRIDQYYKDILTTHDPKPAFKNN